MSLESRLDALKELQAEDFDLLEAAIDHANRLGLDLHGINVNKDGRIETSSFFAKFPCGHKKDAS